MIKKEHKKIELTLFMLYPIVASILSIINKVNFLTGVILFLGIPALYLSLKVPFRTVLRSALFSLILAPACWVINYLATINKQWIIPSTEVPFFIYNIPMFEVTLWGVLLFHFTILFYEYFLDHHFVKKVWYPKTKIYLHILIYLPVFTLLLNMFMPLTYFYLFLGVVGILTPLLLVVFNQPKLLAKFVKVGMYFFYLSFLYEIVALKLGHWYFPIEGKFVGWVMVFGERFPLEEFVFWIALCAMAFLSYFEYFDDDFK